MIYTASELRSRLDRLPRLNLATLSTPLHSLPRLSKKLGPNIFVKREDLTGLGMGGNKIREFEYSIVLVHTGGTPALFAYATELDLSPSN